VLVSGVAIGPEVLDNALEEKDGQRGPSSSDIKMDEQLMTSDKPHSLVGGYRPTMAMAWLVGGRVEPDMDAEMRKIERESGKGNNHFDRFQK
jgi:hypothetical protein